MPTPPSSPSTLRKVAPYLAIAAACFALAWCSFSGDTAVDPLLTPPVQQVTTPPPNTPASTTPIAQTKEYAEEPSLIDQIKALETSGALPELDRSTDIKGPDQNLNGVRDDIEAWIAAQPMKEGQKKAAMQTAEVIQKSLLVDLNDKVAQQAIGDEGMLSTACLSDAYRPDYQDSYKVSSKIEAMTANTKERATRYMQYNRARSGSSTKYPINYACP